MIYKINGKEYKSKKFDFAALIKLEECGVTMDDFSKISKPLTLITSLVAWVMDCDKETAVKEMNEHLENGGSLDDFVKIFDSLKESDFFLKAMKKN